MMDWRSIMRMPFGAMMPPAPGGGMGGGQPGGMPIAGMLSPMLMPGWQQQFNRPLPAPQQQPQQTPTGAAAPIDPMAQYYFNHGSSAP